MYQLCISWGIQPLNLTFDCYRNLEENHIDEVHTYLIQPLDFFHVRKVDLWTSQRVRHALKYDK